VCSSIVCYKSTEERMASNIKQSYESLGTSLPTGRPITPSRSLCLKSRSTAPGYSMHSFGHQSRAEANQCERSIIEYCQCAIIGPLQNIHTVVENCPNNNVCVTHKMIHVEVKGRNKETNRRRGNCLEMWGIDTGDKIQPKGRNENTMLWKRQHKTKSKNGGQKKRTD
jgi:hypothetical protein